jgi:hypothetical protein
LQAPRALLCTAALLAAGCGGDAMTTVSGNITYNGKPVTNGLINFQPAQGKTYGGPIASDGSYSYEIPPGEYRVRIDAPGPAPAWEEGQPEPKPVPRLAPEKYADYKTSGLTAKVTDAGDQTVDFKLD